MIVKFFNKVIKYLYLCSLFFNLNFIKKLNYNNLNFKNIDFVNYKKIKSYYFQGNFILNKNIDEVHSFEFINYAVKLGGKHNIDLSKNNLFKWYSYNKLKLNFVWEGEVTAKRFINIIYNYEFINSLSKKSEKILLKKIIYLHIKRITFDYKSKNEYQLSISEIKAVILINFYLKNKDVSNLKKINNFFDVHIDNLGVHKSYNLVVHSKFINDLYEIKKIFLFFNKLLPDKFNTLILRMSSILKQYIHLDGTLVLFNGSNNNYFKQIMLILKKEDYLKKRSYNNINGIAFFSDKNKKLFFDVIQPTKYDFSNSLNAGTLSIEFSAFGEKIFTNCGASEIGGKNPEYLRYSAAHSTIILKNTNISEIKEKSPHIKYPQKVSFNSENIKNQIIFEGSHNGYINKFKRIIKRKIFIDMHKNIIFGEDSIISTKASNFKVIYHIRFHLMPNIIATQTNNKKNIILKTHNNNIWIFKSESKVSIEESILVDKNTTSLTKQIVIRGIASENKQIEKWTLEKN